MSNITGPNKDYRTAFPNNPLAQWVEDKVKGMYGQREMTLEDLVRALIVRVESLEREVAGLTTVISEIDRVEKERVKRVLAGVEGA